MDTEMITMTKPRLWIITPLSRSANLAKIAPYLQEAGKQFNCHWEIVHDCSSGSCTVPLPSVEGVVVHLGHRPSRPGDQAGHAQVNAALEMVVNGRGFCWRLDDDNLPVPGFFDCLRNEIDSRPDVRVFAFEQFRNGFEMAPSQSEQYVSKPKFAVRGIDSAQYVWDSTIDPSLRFEETKYEADGIFAVALWDRVGPDKVAFISGPQTDYNALHRPSSKMAHFYQNIDGFFHFKPLYQRVVAEAKGGEQFVEIGVWKGRSAAYMGVEIANSGKNIRLTAVDSFSTTPDGSGPRDESRYQEVLQNLLPLSPDHLTLLPTLSVEAAKQFPDKSLDFVFIDADHSYEGVRQDILAWLPKVKPGGLLAGDDYCYPGCEGVKKAVDMLLPDALTPTEFVDGVSGWWEYRVPVPRVRVETPLLMSVFTPMSAVGRPYFDAAYNSLIAQTYKQWEWVVLTNHGGGVPMMHPAHGDARVRFIRANDAMKGIGALKRAACIAASGDTLVELDHDDILMPDALKRIRVAVDHGAEFVYSDFAEFQNDTWHPRVYGAQYGWKTYPITYQGHNLLAHHAPPATPQNLRSILFAPNHVRAWKTSAYWRIDGHDARLLVMDDHDLVVRSYLAGLRFVHLPECLYLYRLHSDSVVLSRNAEVQEMSEKSYQKFCWELARQSGTVWVDHNTQCRDQMKPGEWLFLSCAKEAWYNDRESIPMLKGDFHVSALYDRGNQIEAHLIRLGDGYEPMGERCDA